MSSVEGDWFPTHLRVTVIGARNLRAKRKKGLSDCYTVIRLGPEKYMTSVKGGTLNPEWKEECTLPLPPVLDNSNRWTLHLTVKHSSARFPLDHFLGHVAVPVGALYGSTSRRRNQQIFLKIMEKKWKKGTGRITIWGVSVDVVGQMTSCDANTFTLVDGDLFKVSSKRWYDLQSKPNKPVKDRGQIQLAFQFLRDNMTASAYELSKERPQSVFDKFKDKVASLKYGMTHEILPTEGPSSSMKHHRSSRMSKSHSYAAQMDPRGETNSAFNSPEAKMQGGPEVNPYHFHNIHKSSGDVVQLRKEDSCCAEDKPEKTAVMKLEKTTILMVESKDIGHNKTSEAVAAQELPKLETNTGKILASFNHPVESIKPPQFDDNLNLSFMLAGEGRNGAIERWKIKPPTCCTQCFRHAELRSK